MSRRAGARRALDDRANRPLDGIRAAPPSALVYGVAAHALDYDDTALSGHPSAILVPAILAEANVTGADGRAMITAYAAGYEVWADPIRRDQNQHHRKGWHPSAMFGTIAAACASAVLRKLDAERATPCRRHRRFACRRHRFQFRLDDQAVSGRPRRPIRSARDPARRSGADIVRRCDRGRSRLSPGDLTERRGRYQKRGETR